MSEHTKNVIDPVELIAKYADHPSGFLGCNDETSHFTDPDVPGAIAYRNRGRTVFVLGGPFAPVQYRGALLDRFLTCVVGRRNLVVVQLREADIPLFDERGFTIDQFGSSYSVNLSEFTTKGKHLAKVRQNVSRASREGTKVREIDSAESSAELDQIDRTWLRAKGWHVKKLDFMVGQRIGRGSDRKRLFIAERDGEVTGYISYSPAYGTRPGWLYDLTRRGPDASVGTVELINLTALEQFQSEGAGWLHLGLTPFASIAADSPKSSSSVVSWMVRQLAQRGSSIYPAKTQEAFKHK
ncbi:MAG: phosphatidylglycerol lysyltransferase domain-containing protein, partial [[Mycobacterium] stephanolepidis]